MNTFAKTCAAWACAAVLSACQTTPPVNPNLEAARAALSQAQTNPYAPRAAAVELERAQQALRRAEAAWADRRDTDETQHLSYVAQRRAETALAVAMRAQSEEQVSQAGGERDRVRLEARTREAEAAARTAQSAQASAQSAQASAQSAQATARTAQSNAQTAQGQAEQARQETDAARQRLEQEQARAAALERDLKSLQGQPTQRGMVVTLGDVLFTTGRAVLQPGALRSVQQLGQVLQQYPERRVLVEGFTDSQGSDETNLQLSQRRAEAFRQALLDAGVAANRIEVRGHGEAYPVADNNSAAGRQQNRRVEVLFSDAQGRFRDRS